ncbi:MAG: LLM class flavin-dependent oxidoreductase [Gaiellales bacterium]
MSELTFSVRLGGPDRDIAALTALTRAAEGLGFDQAWVGNDFLGHPGIAALASMLIHTERITVGSGVLDPVSIHPGQIAQIASGFQELSAGRFVLGLGAGSDVFFARGGIVPNRPVRRTREAIVAIRALTNGRSPAGEPGAAEGWDPAAGISHPHPVRIYVGAMGPKLLELAGRLADGALPLCLPPTHVWNVRRHLERGAASAGRDVADLDVAACIWCSIADDGGVARRLLARQIALYSGSLSPDALRENDLDPDEFRHVQSIVDEGRLDDAIDATLASPAMMRLGIAGEPAAVTDACAELLAAGLRHISFGPPLGADAFTALEALGEHVLPALRHHGGA